MTKLLAVGERVIVTLLQEKKEEKTASGIILSTQKEVEQPNLGEVVSVGKNEKLNEIMVGDKIYFKKFAGIEIKNEGTTYVALNFDDILAIVK